ncbi:MAG: hypothetical protein IJ521_00505 [Schwartzia sp.]|nr:hypothetical protein [Schwartzia sp. (in: firmicutes)]
MAFGVFSGGVSLYDLYGLADDIRQGSVGVPLASISGAPIAAQTGEGIVARMAMDYERTGAAVDAAAKALSALAHEIITGRVALPLASHGGDEIAARDGTVVMAHRTA